MIEIETCVNGHIRTEENTKYYRYGRGDKLKRVCSDCRKQTAKQPATAGNPAAHEIAKQSTTEKHEDIEDLIRFGATFTEIIERGGYTTWASLNASLKKRGRTDLLEAMRKKIAASPNVRLSVPYTRSPICGRRDCGRKRYAKKRCEMHYNQERYAKSVSHKVKRHTVKRHSISVCTLTDCDRKHHAKGYCHKHYKLDLEGKLDTNTGD